MKILKTENLKKYYGSGPSLVKALDGVDLSVEEGSLRQWWGHPAPAKALCCICWGTGLRHLRECHCGWEGDLQA